MVVNMTTDTLMKVVTPYYSYCLGRILKNAPPLKKPMTVYRGVDKAYYTDGVEGMILNGQALKMYENEWFVSTSITPDAALTFVDARTDLPKRKVRVNGRETEDFEDGCCMKIIQLLPGVTCLPLWPVSEYDDEIEILLPPGTIYLVQNTRRMEVYAADPTSIWADVDNGTVKKYTCPNGGDRRPRRRIRVSDVIFAKWLKGPALKREKTVPGL
eukprot:jgi/Mesvir1/4861/Mv11135-RA.1